MLPPEILALSVTAASIGFVHTLLGPDHYVPFVALSRARNWSVSKTVGVTLGCGVGHVASSVLLGALGLALGWAVSGMERFESLRGLVAGWMLLLVGIVYGGWGLYRALRREGHGHRHELLGAGHGEDGDLASLPVVPTPWVLFLVFVFGPCEPLIPVLMVPAARGSALGVAWVTGVFALATLTTMTLVVLLGVHGVARIRLDGAERWVHAVAGSILAVCGLAVVLGL